MNPVAEDMLLHYGIPRRSGRYPWGSGENGYQRNRDFLGRIDELKKSGWTENAENVRKEFGMGLKEYREEKSKARYERRLLDVARAKSLKEDGLNDTEIGRIMGRNESSIRSLLNENAEARMNKARQTADFIRDQIDKKGMIDVGADVERELGISKEKLNQALSMLEDEGYPVYSGRFEQVTNRGNWTTQKVICPPGTEYKEIYQLDKVHALNEDNYTSHDDGQTFDKFVYPKSMDSKRLQIRYAEDGGIDKDGIVELRRGVDDLSLGESRYSQVRILVDNNRYIKGMAVYSDNMPDGVDVIFNTNKSKDVPKMDVLKKIKDDPDNPFGSLIKANGQSYYIDKDGNRQLSLINKRADEGDWNEWADALPSQFLGKQSLSMARKQLNLAKADKMAEFEDICSLTNPTVKKHYLEEFADNCDAAAVHLKAAALPGQKYHVIIPVNSLKDTEVYAPNYENGSKVALIRYPHGGTFEIPILTVNNKHAPAQKLIGTDTIDAIGINKKIADRLSGADFDGDTVMCIPTHDKAGRVKITSTPALKGLEGFDPKMEYPEVPGMKYMTKRGTQTQMGIVSNLITDMTLGGASQDELAAAVRHSMVVIDAEKHKLNYKKSEMDNNIAALKKKYQRTIDEDGNEKVGGASTILSRAKGEVSVTKRQGTPKINLKGEEWYDPSKPEGSLIYKTADDAEYQVPKVNKRTGEVTMVTKTRTQPSTRMAETDDAMTLVSNSKYPMEIVYAEYANSMKDLANKARVEMSKTGKIAYSQTAKKTYAKEVKDLEEKLDIAKQNAPRERAAQRMANATVQAKKAANPNMSNEDIKKASQQALSASRNKVGAVARKKRNIIITDKEWEAIQAGAISENKLKQILNNTDADSLRQRAMPRASTKLSAAKINKIKSMQASNYSLAEIAAACNCSTSTISNYLKGVN